MTKNTNIANILDQNSIFAVSLAIGNSTVNVAANSTIIKLANSTVNTGIVVPSAAQYSGSYFLHANGTWQLAGGLPGGSDTYVQFNDGGASLNGTAGFTFNKSTNNAVVANTLTVGANFIANALGAYHTATINAAVFTTTGFRANVTHVVPTSNSSGQSFGNTISRWVITANSVTVSGGASPDSNTLGTALGTTTQRWILLANTIESTGLANLSALNVVNQTNTATLLSTGLANLNALNVTNQTNTATLFVTTSANVGTGVLANSIGLTTTGFVNAVTVVNSASHTIGTTLVANTLGVYHTATMNAASFTTTGLLANATGIHATSNTILLGNTIGRFVITANSVSTQGATINATVIAPTANTILLGNSIGQFVITANTVSAVSVNTTGALINATAITPTSNTILLGNTIGRFVISANSADIGPGTTANSLGVYATTVNAATLSVGTAFIANTTQLTITGKFSANGGVGSTSQVLTSNSTGGAYWSASAGGGAGYYKGDNGVSGDPADIVDIFRINANTLNLDTTIAAGENAQATGPLTLPAGIDLVISAGGRVSIV